MIRRNKIHSNLKQRSLEWFEVRMGKFTSSSVWKLFTKPTIDERWERANDEFVQGIWKNKGFGKGFGNTEMNRAIKVLNFGDSEKKEVKKALSGKSEMNRGAFDVLDICEAFENVHVFSKGAKTHILEKASDFIYFDTEESKPSPDMLRGIVDEDYAKQAYIDKHKLGIKDTQDVGFIDYTFGETEDFLINETGSSPDMLIKDNGLLEIKCPNRINHMKNIMDVNSAEDLFIHHEDYWWQCHHQILCSKRDWCTWMSFDRTLTHSPVYSNLAMHFVYIQRDKKVIEQFEKVIPLACQLRDDFTEKLLRKISYK